MTYKETLFFIGKCLTVSLEEKNRLEIKHQLENSGIDWDSVVKVSTAHYVFPALYCNLKRADFLHYLPSALVEYMKHITDLNRERNQQIIEQAKEINQLLLENNITPIFLKGTGNLLEGLYEDIAERMVGDIDFIVNKNVYESTIKFITGFGYSKVVKSDYDYPSFKHHPRLQKENKIAAVEIHKELLIKKYANEFNYEIVKTDSQEINNFEVLSFKNQLSLSIIAKQINDKGFHYKNIALRNAYDVFLLSKKTAVKTAFNHLNNLQKPLNSFVAISNLVFNKVASLEYVKTKETENYLSEFSFNLENDSDRKKNFEKTKKRIFIAERLAILKKSVLNKKFRKWLFKRITDKNWQKEKLIQFGLKKTKPNA